MDERDLWHTFAASGSVMDYLRYRGINVATARQEDSRGEQRQTTSDDRRADYS